MIVCNAEIDEYGDVTFDFYNSKDVVYFVNYKNLVYDERSIFLRNRYIKKKKIIFITDEYIEKPKIKTFFRQVGGNYMVNFDIDSLNRHIYDGEEIPESYLENDEYTICLSRRISTWKKGTGNNVLLSIGSDDSSFFNPKIKIKKWVEIVSKNLAELIKIFNFDGINIDVQHIGNDTKRARVLS